MAKHLGLLATLVALLVLSPAVRADTFSPTYDFSGVITATGTNPTCGASPGPCVETIDVSFEYFYDIPTGFTLNQGAESVTFVPGTSSVAATGEFGALVGDPGFFENSATFYYLEFLFPGGGLGFPPHNEIDLNLDPTTNTFGTETYFCAGECQNLFGGTGGNFSVPATLQYTVREVPEPPTFVLLLCGIFLLGVLRFAKAGRKTSRLS